jgi:hypothetical protein
VFSPARPEIVIANNSGIFFSLASLKNHGKASHPNLRVILPEFWLDNTHSDYDSLNWGQTIMGIPWYARQEFFEIYPNQADDELITWKQYKELRSYVINKIKSSGIQILQGTPIIEKESNNNYKVDVANTSFSTPSDTYFYNVFREPELRHTIARFPQISHTKLYYLPRVKVPDRIIVAGNGRSTYWLCIHFPNSLIAGIKQNGISLTLFGNETMPTNLLAYNLEEIGPSCRYQPKVYEIDGRHVSMLTDSKGEVKDFIGEFYAALGLRINSAITQNVSPDNLLLHPDAALFDWVAPEEIPVGGLMESTLRWAVLTENLTWAFETHCYHENYFINILSDMMKSKNILLPLTFFDILRDKMIDHYKLVNRKIITKLPSDEEAISIYVSAFKELFGNDFDMKRVAYFELSLREIIETRITHYNTPKP